MAKLKRGRSNRLILDIGSSAIRLCELTQTKTGFQLTRYMQKEVILDPASDEETKKKARTEALQELLKAAKVRARKVVFGVPGQSVFTRTRALPPVKEYKVTQIVQYEIRQQIPFALDQIALDYQVLSRAESGGYEVLMAAIKVDVVEKQLEMLKSIKKQPDIVDICPIAAYNWLKFAGDFGDQGECVAMIDMGATTTDLVFERGGQFRFTRSLNIGGNDITQAIAKSLNTSFVEAEKLKRERGFAPTGDPQRDQRGGEILGPSLQRLVTEITRSFAYFRSQPGGGPVSRVVLTGGGACLRNIVPYLQRQLGVEVRIAHPLAGLALGPGAQEVNERPEQAATVLGLALRCAQTVPIEINLIPPRIREAARRKEQAFYWFMSLVTLALIMASIIPLHAKRDENVKKQIAQLREVLKKYDPALGAATDGPPPASVFEGQLKAARALRSDYEGKLSTLDKMYQDRVPWLSYISAVNEARPAEGGMVFHTIESTTIVEQAVVVTQRRAGFRGGSKKDDDGPSDSGGGGMAMAQGVGASTPVQVNDQFASKGFPAFTPPGSGARSATAVAMGQGEAPEPTLPEKPNGIAIIGYVKDPKAIQVFVERLQANPLFDSAHVIFSDVNVKDVPVTEMDSVPAISKAQQQAATVSDPSLMEDEKDRGGMRSFRSGGGSNYAPGGVAQEMISSFRVDAKFASTGDSGSGAPAGGGTPATPGAAAPMKTASAAVLPSKGNEQP